jgi:hypothetical protein
MTSFPLAVLAVILAALIPSTTTTTADELFEYRVRTLQLNNVHIYKKLVDLNNEIDSVLPPYDYRSFIFAWARIINLEASNPCDKGEVTCGGDHPECVHQLFVCDGRQDCSNGRDEDAVICSGDVVHPGSTFRGIVRWKKCIAAADHLMTVTITSEQRSSFFGSRSNVKATITMEPEESEWYDYEADGYFVYATRQLVLQGRVQTGVTNVHVCVFNLGNNDLADCQVVLETSDEVCGIYRVVRV